MATKRTRSTKSSRSAWKKAATRKVITAGTGKLKPKKSKAVRKQEKLTEEQLKD